MAKKIEYSEVKALAFRFLRTVVPQIPALLAYASGNQLLQPYIPELVLLGGVLTTLDKYLRDKKVY